MIKQEDEFYVYENDELKIRYFFWRNRGMMAFEVYNKTDAPIYINWDRSSFISNGNKTNYYTDGSKVTFSITGASLTSYFQGRNWYKQGYGTYETPDMVTGVRKEKVTFIPPKTKIYKGFRNIFGRVLFNLDKNTKDTTVNGSKGFITSMGKDDMTFRNYITYSKTEDFKEQSHIDNGFFVSKVLTVKRSEFQQEDEEGNRTSKYIRPTRYYINDLKEQDLFPEEKDDLLDE